MKTFRVEMITPDKVFFEGDIIRLTAALNDGSIEILANHMPAICEIITGKCIMTLSDNTQRIFVSNDGIMNIGNNKVVITSDFLEWEEDLERVLNELKENMKQEHERRSQSFVEHRMSAIALERLFANLSIKKK